MGTEKPKASSKGGHVPKTKVSSKGGHVPKT